MSELDKYFDDSNLTKAFAMEHAQEFLYFVEEYLEDQETESKIDSEREEES